MSCKAYKLTAPYLDAGYGSCSLREEHIAQLVEEALLHFDGQRYRLLAWVIMPNHVHVLTEVLPGHPLAEIVHSWKSFTAKEANTILGRSGAFWQPEYFDRFIRDEQHLANAIRYIHDNPVKARLVGRAEEWPYSSASKTRSNASETLALPGIEREWHGAQGLAEDVRCYGSGCGMKPKSELAICTRR
jgi:REP element-mobilizing transposase RayT